MKVIGWQLLRLVEEAKRDILGATVEQIRKRSDRQRLALVCGSTHGRTYLVTGVRGPASGFFWTSEREIIPRWEDYEPSEAFNRLRGARVVDIMMPAADRVVVLRFEKLQEEDREAQSYLLVMGWLGTLSNIWLVRGDGSHEILESFHRDTVETGKGRKRELVLPMPPALADWRTITLPEYRRLRQQDPAMEFTEFTRRGFWGIDTGLSEQIAARIATSGLSSTDDSAQRDWAEMEALLITARLACDPSVPLSLPANVYDPSQVRIATNDPAELVSPSLAHLLSLCDQQVSTQQATTANLKQVSDALTMQLQKIKRRLTAAERALAEIPRAEDYKRCADLLGAHRHLLKRGMTEVSLPGWESPDSVSIILEPSRSAQQNIDAYYRRARKILDAAEAACGELPGLRVERDRLQSFVDSLEADADDEVLIEEARRVLGITDSNPDQPKGRPKPRLPYREFAVGMHRLWVGRSSRDNDDLTMHYTGPHDLFFHAQGTPGSHVILKRDSASKEIDKQTLTIVAQVAAYFSKAKNAGLVPVVYTEARFVRKPRKAPAGTVTVEREKSLMVRPLPPPGYHAKTKSADQP